VEVKLHQQQSRRLPGIKLPGGLLNLEFLCEPMQPVARAGINITARSITAHTVIAAREPKKLACPTS